MNKKDLLQMKDKINKIYDKYPKLSLLLTGILGLRNLKDPRNISRLTGTEHLFHVTPQNNVNSIINDGLRTEKSFDPSTISHQHGIQDIVEGHIFLGRTKKPTNRMSFIHKVTSGYKKLYPELNLKKEDNILKILRSYIAGDKTKTLNIRIPYEKLIKMETSPDPGYISLLESLKWQPNYLKKKLAIFMNHEFSPDHTIAIKNNILPEYIKGSDKFKYGIIKELQSMIPYIRNNPGRFLRGAGSIGTGIGLTGLAGYQSLRLLKDKLNNRRKFYIL